MGAAPILSADQQHELRQALQKPAPDGGVWTGLKVAQWITDRTGKRVHRQRGWEYLQRLGVLRCPPAPANMPLARVVTTRIGLLE